VKKKFSSDKIDKILHDKKPSFDRSGFRFDKFIVSSTNVASSSKTMFVKPKLKEVKADKACLDKGKSVV